VGSIDGTGYVITAFVATWVVVIGYLIRLHVALKRAREQYEQSGGTQ
jgi:CcmD family protein